jgi:hypothetical protein
MFMCVCVGGGICACEYLCCVCARASHNLTSVSVFLCAGGGMYKSASLCESVFHVCLHLALLKGFTLQHDGGSWRHTSGTAATCNCYCLTLKVRPK